MNRITADSAMHKALSQLNNPTEIRDVNGNVVGYFTPANQQEAQLYAEARASFDKDEMKRRKESGANGLTTAQVLEHLKSSNPS